MSIIIKLKLEQFLHSLLLQFEQLCHQSGMLKLNFIYRELLVECIKDKPTGFLDDCYTVLRSCQIIPKDLVSL